MVVVHEKRNQNTIKGPDLRLCTPRGTCSLPTVYLQFTCCLLVAHTMCVASPMGMQGANNDQCMCALVPTGHAKPKRGLGPLAMPRHSHFLTLCQEYPGGPKLLLSLFLKFATLTSKVAQNPHQHGSGATANHTSTNCGHWGTKSTHGGHSLPCLNFF